MQCLSTACRPELEALSQLANLHHTWICCKLLLEKTQPWSFPAANLPCYKTICQAKCACWHNSGMTALRVTTTFWLDLRPSQWEHMHDLYSKASNTLLMESSQTLRGTYSGCLTKWSCQAAFNYLCFYPMIISTALILEWRYLCGGERLMQRLILSQCAENKLCCVLIQGPSLKRRPKKCTKHKKDCKTKRI